MVRPQTRGLKHTTLSSPVPLTRLPLTWVLSSVFPASLHSQPGFCSPQLHPRQSEALLSTPVTPVCRRGCPDGEDEYHDLSGASLWLSIHQPQPFVLFCAPQRQEKPDPSLCGVAGIQLWPPFAACPLPWEPPCSLPCFMQPPGLFPLLVPHN